MYQEVAEIFLKNPVQVRVAGQGRILPMTTGTNTDEDELAVHAVVQSFARAVRLRDVEGMLAFCAPDVMTFDLMPPLRHEGLEAVRSIWIKTLSAFDAPVDFEVQHLKVFLEGRIAFTRSVNRFGGRRLAGGETSTWVAMTLGLRKIDRDWKIIHQHISVPFDMATGKALVDLEP